MAALTSCPAPFIIESAYPDTGGYIAGRSCSSLYGNTSCCLPCPATDYVYSRSFKSNLQIAYWFNVPSLAFEIMLLLTFMLLSADVSHTHYLSVGLVIAMIMVQLAFTIPLATKPEICFDAITPKDMHSSLSCAWTGALLVAGAMAIASWIMLRSVWMHLRICWNIRVQDSRRWFWSAQAIGWGLPSLFLAVELPVTGVSYRLGPGCFPNQKRAFETWFGWLIAFGVLGLVVQVVTTAFCVSVYLKDVFYPPNRKQGTELVSQRRIDPETMTSSWDDGTDSKKLAWGRVRKILRSQWRTMVLCTVWLICLVYYGVVFVQQTSSALQDVPKERADKLQEWALCLVVNQGDKKNCGPIARVLGLSEGAIVATFYIVAFIGIFAFALMFRNTMIEGWWFFLRHPRRAMRNPSVGEVDFILDANNQMHGPGGLKRKSFGRQLESEKFNYHSSEPRPEIPRVPTIGDISPIGMDMYYQGAPVTDPDDAGILPEPKDSRQASVNETAPAPTMSRNTSHASVLRTDSTTLGPIPEAGDVGTRREGSYMDMFSEEDPYDVPKRRRKTDELNLV